MLRVARTLRYLFLFALVATTSCTYEATEVLVIVDTDIPVSQQLALRVTTRRGASNITSATPPDRSFVVGGPDGGVRDGGSALPASFGIVPHEGDPLDSQVTLRVEVQSGAIALRRIARFRFTPRQSTTIRVFLTLRCATPVTGCTHTSPCTQQDLCEERGEACGPEGLCVPIATMTMPFGDAGATGLDARVPGDASDARDASDVVVRDAIDATDASDIPMPPLDSGGCGAGERVCGAGCIPSGNCCTDVDCGGGGVCSGGSCACASGTRDCGGTCIPNGACCNDSECGGGRMCSSGSCVCATGTRACGGACIPSGNCCNDSDCGGRACSGGACVCPSGTRDCGGTCIPSGNCCSDGDCGANHACSGGACVCAAGTRVCGAQCIPTATCCNDGDCGAPLVCPGPGSACSCPAITRRPIYRFARTSNNDHVYSTSATELSGAPGWIAEGVRFYLYPDPCPPGTIPLRRFANTSTNFHFYTSDAAEAASLPGTFADEGSIGCVATSTVCGSIPLYRKLLCNTAHFYSTSRPELDAVCGTDEGSVGEVWTGP